MLVLGTRRGLACRWGDGGVGGGPGALLETVWHAFRVLRTAVGGGLLGRCMQASSIRGAAWEPQKEVGPKAVPPARLRPPPHPQAQAFGQLRCTEPTTAGAHRPPHPRHGPGQGTQRFAAPRSASRRGTRPECRERVRGTRTPGLARASPGAGHVCLRVGSRSASCNCRMSSRYRLIWDLRLS